MTAEAAFDALRSYKRELTGEGLSQADVDAFNSIFAGWKPKPSSAPLNPTALTDAGKFFQAVHGSFGALTQSQVDGFNTLLQAMATAAWPIAWVAYGLATAWHETAKQMQPVKEAYWLSEDWRQKNLPYFPWYGRGFVQLTWQKNYKRADDELGLNGALIANADDALKPVTAAKIMVRGMAEGWFTAISLTDKLPTVGKAAQGQFEQARKIINGTDKATLIAGYALQFQTTLDSGGWR